MDVLLKNKKFKPQRDKENKGNRLFYLYFLYPFVFQKTPQQKQLCLLCPFLSFKKCHNKSNFVSFVPLCLPVADRVQKTPQQKQ
jgi:hypothetical protein